MTDLGKRLRDHFEAAGPPLDIEAIVADARRSAVRRHRVRVVGTAATAAALVVLGLVAYVLFFPARSMLPVVEEPPAPDTGPIEDRGPIETRPRSTDHDEPVVDVGSAAAAPGTVREPGVSRSQAPSTGAVPTLPRGRILYESEEVIRTYDVGGGDPRDIAAGFQPRWSPDGTRISFRDDAGLWTARTDGTGRIRVAGSDVDLDGAPFSPDGSRLLYTAGLYDCGPDAPPVPPFGCAPSSDAGIWSVGVDGRNPRRVVAGAAWHPVWSPDGTRIAYSRDGRIYVARADGNDEQLVYEPRVGDDADRPQFSPDGTRLAFYVTLDAGPGSGSNDPCGPRMELWTVNADGRSARPLTRGPFWPGDPGGAWVRAPQWSPDGTMVTFADVGDVWVVNVADGDARSITSTVSDDCVSGTADADPTWSPDGAFVVAFSRVSERSPVGLFAIRPDGSEHHLLVAGRSRTPTWRP